MKICEAEAPFGLSWDRDGIVFGQPIGIMRISPDGGKPEVLVARKNGELRRSASPARRRDRSLHRCDVPLSRAGTGR